ncbi:unnamed protein product [Allacma fusca]|uniref:Uncharacterized protein n=1 Tax=Allacma fusca TaxID=39272 RepID=A0A8J2K3P4_9HEXA|nr:unnamed protein product [Allacma fusca]
MEERHICCCGARRWTVVIGCLHIFGAVLWLFLIGIILEAVRPSSHTNSSSKERYESIDIFVASSYSVDPTKEIRA